jgi:hypothetical protein
MDSFEQKTLVYNVAYKKLKNVNKGFEHIDEIINQLYPDKCVIVNTGHGFFKHPKIFIKDSNNYNKEKIIKKANKVGVLFFMWEPLCFYSKSKNHLKVTFYHEFKHSVEDIYSYEIDDILDFCKKTNITNFEIRLCDYDYKNILAKSYPDIKMIYDDLYIKTTKNSSIGKEKNNFTKRFVCPNARYTPHRHLTMCHLVDKDGLFSWNFTCKHSLLNNINWLDQTNPYYQKMHVNNSILNSVSFSIDKALPKQTVNVLSDYASIAEDVDHMHKNNFYKHAFCAIVNETRFAQPFANFSEKSLRPIKCNLPFILVAPPYTLSLLKDRGFKTFDQWWDESYDQEENHSTRLYKIFDVINYLHSLSDTEIQEMYDEMFPMLVYNSEHLQNIVW